MLLGRECRKDGAAGAAGADARRENAGNSVCTSGAVTGEALSQWLSHVWVSCALGTVVMSASWRSGLFEPWCAAQVLEMPLSTETCFGGFKCQMALCQLAKCQLASFSAVGLSDVLLLLQGCCSLIERFSTSRKQLSNSWAQVYGWRGPVKSLFRKSEVVCVPAVALGIKIGRRITS